MSGNYKRSCASCHRPQKAFTDQRVTARAYAFSGNLAVNTPTLLGAVRQRHFFHDGRAGNLAAVIEAVLTNPTELNTTYEEATTRLAGSEYRRLFEQVYGRGPSRETINRALITYLNQLGSTKKQPQPALPEAGYRLFAKAGCPACHAGSDFRDGRRHEVEPGRWVRTPTLNYLPLTPPYLASGSAPTLEAVLASPFHARPRQVRSLRPAQVRSLINFLRTLSTADTTWLAEAVPSALPSIPGAPARRVGGSY